MPDRDPLMSMRATPPALVPSLRPGHSPAERPAHRHVRTPWPCAVQEPALTRTGQGQPRLLATALSLGLALGGIALPTACVSAAELRWAAQTELTSLDPHAQPHPQAQAVLQHVYEALTRFSPDLQIEPALASRWEQVSPLVWRFYLRENVRFHDGTPLTADDVQFSLERLKGAGSTLGTMLGSIRSVRRVNDLTLDILLDRPMPLLPRILTDARILSRRWARSNQAEAISGNKADATGYTARHANGTGPYRIEDGWAPGQPLSLVRNRIWWDRGGFPGNADTVTYQAIPLDEDRIRALLDGKVDLVTDLPGQRVPALRHTPPVRVVSNIAQRTLLIGMDQYSESLAHGQTGLHNPFRDRRVRQAMSLALDMKALQRIGHGMYRPAGTIVAPGVNGWTPALDRRAASSVKQARQLMRRAGYAQGFSVTLDCPNNRYAYDQRICQALVPMWKRIGIRVKVNSQPFASLIPRLETLDSSLWMLGWGSPDFDALQNLLSLAYTRSDRIDGAYNAGRISDPSLDKLVDRARTEGNPQERTDLLESALDIVKTQYYYLPLLHARRAWAMRPPVRLLARPGERPDLRFIRVVPARQPARKSGKAATQTKAGARAKAALSRQNR